jgi:hypothetical protein
MFRSLWRDPEGHDVDQAPKLRISPVVTRFEPAIRSQQSEPHVALAFARAHESRPGTRGIGKAIDPDNVQESLAKTGRSRMRETFERFGVVEIHDPPALAHLDTADERGRERWRDDDVGGCDELR